MSVLNKNNLYVNFYEGVTPNTPILNRCYTVTRCEKTNQILLSVGRHNIQNVGCMREILVARWTCINNRYVLKCCCRLGCGTRADVKSRYEQSVCDVPIALEAIACGDRLCLDANPCLCKAPVYVDYTSPYYRPQIWQTVNAWRID